MTRNPDSSEMWAERPNSVPWPPVLLVAAFGIGYLIDKPLARLVAIGPWPSVVTGFGVALVAVAVAIIVWAILTMHRARTNILPHLAADRLVTDGPFGFSRNPIYLGDVVLVIGVGLAGSWVGLLVMAVPLALLLHHLAIIREERHLEARFGAAWRAYARAVPRWIGPI